MNLRAACYFKYGICQQERANNIIGKETFVVNSRLKRGVFKCVQSVIVGSDFKHLVTFEIRSDILNCTANISVKECNNLARNCAIDLQLRVRATNMMVLYSHIVFDYAAT